MMSQIFIIAAALLGSPETARAEHVEGPDSRRPFPARRIPRQQILPNIPPNIPMMRAYAPQPPTLQPPRPDADVEVAARFLGVHDQLQTDPTLIRDILDEMGMNDFVPQYIPMARFLSRVAYTPLPLAPLIDAVKRGLVRGHPTVLRFLSEASGKRWLSASPQVERALHYAYILEAFTAAMANSNAFLEEVVAHTHARMRARGMDPNSTLRMGYRVYQETDSAFRAVKQVSVNPAITQMIHLRERVGVPYTAFEVARLYKKGELSALDQRLLTPKQEGLAHPGLQTNILEAGVTEWHKGYRSNATAALALIRDIDHAMHPQEVALGPVLPTTYARGAEAESTEEREARRVEAEGRGAELGVLYASIQDPLNVSMKDDFSAQWTELYETWNMAFVLSELDNLHLFLPKLLIPSVLSANPESYLSTRVLALWLTINTALFNEMDGKSSLPGPSNRVEMAEAWGRVNAEFSRDLIAGKAGPADECMRAESVESFKKDFSPIRRKLFDMMLNGRF